MCLKRFNIDCINQPKHKIKVPNSITQNVMDDVRNNINIEEVSIKDLKAELKR
jgi:hypothetical protein